MTESESNLNQPDETTAPEPAAQPVQEDADKVRRDFERRLLVANLRTEAVKAGMIDLDGLRLIDLEAVKLDANDTVIDGASLMANLRRNKPWLFGSMSSSSASAAPASRPVRAKTAMDMTDEEYATARAAITKQYF